ncbi:MAG: hypothetical protein M3220_14220 [Chloroflexota bacterium]|nr:hypothetical protein [Chloroflexota bacterium]
MKKHLVFLSALLLLLLAVTGCGGATIPVSGTEAGLVEEVAPETATPKETDMDDKGTASLGNLAGPTAEIAERALAYLSNETSLQASEFSLQRAEAVTWRDSSLGCPQPDMMYAQVLTPGYQVVFEGNGESFYVHTNEDASTLVLCDNPEEPLPQE